MVLALELNKYTPFPEEEQYFFEIKKHILEHSGDEKQNALLDLGNIFDAADYDNEAFIFFSLSAEINGPHRNQALLSMARVLFRAKLTNAQCENPKFAARELFQYLNTLYPDQEASCYLDDGLYN